MPLPNLFPNCPQGPAPNDIGSSWSIRALVAMDLERFAASRANDAAAAARKAVADAFAGMADRGLASSGIAEGESWRVGCATLRAVLRAGLSDLSGRLMDAHELDTFEAAWKSEIASQYTALRNDLARQSNAITESVRLTSVLAEEGSCQDLAAFIQPGRDRLRRESSQRRFQWWSQLSCAALGGVLGGGLVTWLFHLVSH
jgi:hypothetical protein